MSERLLSRRQRQSVLSSGLSSNYYISSVPELPLTSPAASYEWHQLPTNLLIRRPTRQRAMWYNHEISITIGGRLVRDYFRRGGLAFRWAIATAVAANANVITSEAWRQRWVTHCHFVWELTIYRIPLHKLIDNTLIVEFVSYYISQQFWFECRRDSHPNSSLSCGRHFRIEVVSMKCKCW